MPEKMTRKELERYHDVVVRLKALSTTIVTDSVKGSSPDYPYTSHSVTLHGVRADEKARKEIKLLEAEKQSLDEFIDGINDIRTKTLLDLHYRKGWSWCKVAHETGKSMDANKNYLKRFFKSPLLSPCGPL